MNYTLRILHFHKPINNCRQLDILIISEFYLFLAQVNCEERLFKHYAFRSQKIAAFLDILSLVQKDICVW